MSTLFLAPKSPSFEGPYHVHPRYRQALPQEAMLANVKAGSDSFAAEKYHDQVAEILADWTTALLKAPTDVAAVARVLSDQFVGSSLLPAESKRVGRSNQTLEIQKESFSQTDALSPQAFLQDLQAYLANFTSIETADFQVTRMEGSPENLRTQILFEFVGGGKDFHREQRVGYWDMEWRNYRLHKWRASEQTRSRSTLPCYADISSFAFKKTKSYATQLRHGADYWRTVLDSSCGIDIYGHNGVSVGDFDGDGFDDLYVCQPAGLPNRLFRNLGDGTFEDVTEISGVGLLDNTTSAVFADFDNNGRQDLIIVRAAGPLLLLNQGEGRFKLKPDAFHFATPPQGTFTGAAAADYNRDGFLDIYFCLYAFYKGSDQYKYPLPYYDAENGPPNFLMRNNGDATFSDVTLESGMNQNNNRYSFCCGWGDFNGDGWPDLYVVNDFGRKNLYRNKGDGTFHDVAAEAEVEDVGAGMSVSWLDYNNDGFQDLYVANMWTSAGLRVSSQREFAMNAPEPARALDRKHAMGNSLLRNAGAGIFGNTTTAADAGMGRWAWSSDTLDFDHDSFADIYIANGMLSGPLRQDLNSFFWRQVVANSPDQPKPSPLYEQGWNAINELIRSDYTWSGYERNVFYANNGDGTFSDVSGALGIDFREDGRAFAVADFNHDGRQEIVLKNRNGPQLRLLQNVMPNLPASISFCLTGSQSNRDAIGAAVSIETRSGSQTKYLQAGSGFLSQHSKDVFFGLGTDADSVNASVKWPSGLVQHLKALPANHRIWLDEARNTPSRIESFKPFQSQPPLPVSHERPEAESLPENVETWLLSPIQAPDFSLPDLLGHLYSLHTLTKPALLHFCTVTALMAAKDREPFGQNVVAIGVDDPAKLRAVASERAFSFPLLSCSDDTLAVYSILYRYLFDRHRDLNLPTSFLIDVNNDIVKVYQGHVTSRQLESDFRTLADSSQTRIGRALPFHGVADTFEYFRNYLTLGSAYFERGYFDQSCNFFALATRDDPKSAEAHYGLGSAYLKLEKTSQARISFEAAVKLRADYPDTLSNAWNNLGLLSTQAGEMEAAIGYFKSALIDNPNYSIALLNLGNAYRQQRRWEAARTTLEATLSLNAEDPEANYSLAMVFAQTDQSDKAYEYLQRALRYRPAYPEALNNLGILYLRTRRRDDAVRVFEECIRLAPEFSQSYLNLARVYVVEGDNSKARILLLNILKLHPGDAEATHALEQIP